MGYGAFGIYSLLAENGVLFFDSDGARIYPAIGISYKYSIHEQALVQDYYNCDEGYNRTIRLQYRADIGQEGGWGVLVGAGISYITYQDDDYNPATDDTKTQNQPMASLALTYQVMGDTPIFKRKAAVAKEE